jgi:hypothetical protein
MYALRSALASLRFDRLKEAVVGIEDAGIRERGRNTPFEGGKIARNA